MVGTHIVTLCQPFFFLLLQDKKKTNKWATCYWIRSGVPWQENFRNPYKIKKTNKWATCYSIRSRVPCQKNSATHTKIDGLGRATYTKMVQVASPWLCHMMASGAMKHITIFGVVEGRCCPSGLCGALALKFVHKTVIELPHIKKIV